MDDYTLALIIIGDLTLTNRKLTAQLQAQEQSDETAEESTDADPL